MKIRQEIRKGRLLTYSPNHHIRKVRTLENGYLRSELIRNGLIPDFYCGIGCGRSSTHIIYETLLFRKSGGSVIRADIQKYFPNSNPSNAKKILRKYCLDFFVIDSFFTNKKNPLSFAGLPQGDPCSPLLSALASKNMFLQLRSKFEFRLYVDDLIVFVKPGQTLDEFKRYFLKVQMPKDHYQLSKKPSKCATLYRSHENITLLGIVLIKDSPYIMPKLGNSNFGYYSLLSGVCREALQDRRSFSTPYKDKLLNDLRSLLFFNLPQSNALFYNAFKGNGVIPRSLRWEHKALCFMSSLLKKFLSLSPGNKSTHFGICQERTLSCVLKIILLLDQGNWLRHLDPQDVIQLLSDRAGGVEAYPASISYPPIPYPFEEPSKKRVFTEVRANPITANNLYQKLKQRQNSDYTVRLNWEPYSNERMSLRYYFYFELWATFIRFCPFFTLTVVFSGFKGRLLYPYQQKATWSLLKSELQVINTYSETDFKGFNVPFKTIKRVLRAGAIRKYFKLVYPETPISIDVANIFGTVIYPHHSLAVLQSLANQFNLKEINLQQLQSKVEKLRARLRQKGTPHEFTI